MRSIEELKKASRELMDVSQRLLRTDGGTQYRDGIEEETMCDYLDAMKDGAVFPPIETVFDGQHHWVVDGFHRLAAHYRRGSPSIKVSCIHGTLEEARLLALGANTQHGLRRDAKTKRRIVEEAKVERGEHMPNFVLILRLARALSMTPGELVDQAVALM